MASSSNMADDARAASQAAQQANAEYHEELARRVIQRLGRNAEFDYSNIGETLGYKNTNKTVQGVYVAIGRLLEREPDRRGDAQRAQETSSDALRENEPGLVLACLRAMGQGTTPSLDVGADSPRGGYLSALFRGVPFRPRN